MDQNPSNQESQVMEVLPPPSSEYVAKAEAKSLEFMNPKRWQVMKYMAESFIQSGALPSNIKNAPQLIMIFQAGYEAGLQPLESLNAFYFVNGKLSMYGDMVIAQIIKAGHEVIWGECNGETATVTIRRGDTGKEITGTFTMAMAKARGYTKNPIYTTSPENMLKFKAVGMIAKFIVPDALHGIQIKEELEGSVVEEGGDATKSHKKPVKQVEESPAAHKSLEEVLNEPALEDGEKPKAVKKTKKVEEQEIPKNALL